MKFFKLLLTICLSQVILSADEYKLKVTVLSKQQLNYENGNLLSTTTFRVLCINGYQWLQYGNSQGSLTQMFDDKNGIIDGPAKPIKCKN
jgi:hypothetical protein